MTGHRRVQHGWRSDWQRRAREWICRLWRAVTRCSCATPASPTSSHASRSRRTVRTPAFSHASMHRLSCPASFSGLLLRALGTLQSSGAFVPDMLLTATLMCVTSAWPRIWRLPQQVNGLHIPPPWFLNLFIDMCCGCTAGQAY